MATDIEEEIDHEYTGNIICPYCGAEDGDSWECAPNEEGLGYIECPVCFKTFTGTRNISVDYTTWKIDWFEEWALWNFNIINQRAGIRAIREKVVA